MPADQSSPDRNKHGIPLRKALSTFESKRKSKIRKGYTELEVRSDAEEVAKQKAAGVTVDKPKAAKASKAKPKAAKARTFNPKVAGLLHTIYGSTARTVSWLKCESLLNPPSRIVQSTTLICGRYIALAPVVFQSPTLRTRYALCQEESSILPRPAAACRPRGAAVLPRPVRPQAPAGRASRPSKRATAGEIGARGPAGAPQSGPRGPAACP